MTTHRRGERAQTLARRQGIVAAGLVVFSSSGFHGASLRDVAERAGLSQAGLLHHFRSKEQLLKAVLAWRDDEARRQLGESVPHGLDLIRRLIARSSATPTRELVQLEVIVSAEGSAADHPVHGYVRERHASAFETVRRAFQLAMGRGAHADRAHDRPAGAVATRPKSGRHRGRPDAMPAAVADDRTVAGRKPVEPGNPAQCFRKPTVR